MIIQNRLNCCCCQRFFQTKKRGHGTNQNVCVFQFNRQNLAKIFSFLSRDKNKHAEQYANDVKSNRRLTGHSSNIRKRRQNENKRIRKRRNEGGTKTNEYENERRSYEVGTCTQEERAISFEAKRRVFLTNQHKRSNSKKGLKKKSAKKFRRL